MGQCNVAFVSTERPFPHIMCTLQRGHDGAHRGFDVSGNYGAIWNDERRLKVYEGGRQYDDITKEPA